MKIYNSPIVTNSQHTSFKAISPVAQKQLKSVIKSPVSKDLFAKVAGVAGLSSIIAWVNSFKKSENKVEELNKLDVIDTAWAQKSNERILNPEQSESFLDLVSEIDENESLLWTKALLSDTDKDAYIPKEKASLQSAKEMFLTNDANELFMETSANRAINTIMTQINALLNATDTQRDAILSTIEIKFNSLVKQANELQNNEETSELYSKLTNIIKAFTFAQIFDQSKEILAEEKPILEGKNEGFEETVAEENVDENTEEQASVVPVNPNNGIVKIDLSKIDPEGESKRSRFRSKSEKIDLEHYEVVKPNERKTVVVEETKITEKLKPIEITDSNKEFVNNVFLPLFEDQAAIDPNVYSAYIDLIQKIYEGYTNESVKTSFLNQLKFADKTDMLELYTKIVDFDKDKIQFVNFSRIEQFKNANGGTLTKEEYEILNKYYTKGVKYVELYINAPERYVANTYFKKPLIRINFAENLSTKERLKMVSDFHRIIFNVPADKSITSEPIEKVFSQDVAKELAKMIASYYNAEEKNKEHLPEYYNNILSFLRINVEDLKSDYDKEGRAGIEEALKEIFEQNGRYLRELLVLLNNEKFSGFIETTHARMRFIDRFVFDQNKWQKEIKGLKKSTTDAIKRLDKSIAEAPFLQFVNYCTDKYVANESSKYGARVLFINETVIAVDDKGHIHTMF